MRISQNDWKNYISKLSKLSYASGALIEDWIEKNGLDDPKALVDYAYRVVQKYGNGSAALSATMYDVIADLQGAIVPPAEMAPLPKYGEVSKTVYGTLKTSQNPSEMGGAVSRLVKRAGADTTLQNAQRDRAEFAWIPSGDTCAFCLTLASRGWQTVSKKALKNGHAEHIHSNCNCEYAIRFDKNSGVAGYDPEKYKEMYDNAEGKNSKDKINSMRRMIYQDNREREQTFAMQRNAETLWSGKPRENSKLVIEQLNDYASQKNVILDQSFKSFDGDVDMVKEFIDTIDTHVNQKEHMRNKPVKISVSYTMDDDTYAETQSNNIILNGFAYRDRALLDKDYQDRVAEHWFTQGSTYLDIPVHESAHVIIYLDQLKTSKIVENVFGADMANASFEISEKISKYATKNGNELIAESYVLNNNDSIDESVLNVLNYCGILKKKGGL